MPFLPCNTMHTPGKTVTVKKSPAWNTAGTDADTVQHSSKQSAYHFASSPGLLDFLLNSPPNLNSRSQVMNFTGT